MACFLLFLPSIDTFQLYCAVLKVLCNGLVLIIFEEKDLSHYFIGSATIKDETAPKQQKLSFCIYDTTLYQLLVWIATWYEVAYLLWA